MQLTQFTDYALRTLIYAAVRKDQIITVAQIADAYGISKNHLIKIVHKLGQLGILKTFRGNQGGFQLNCDPRELNLGELVQKLEPHFFIVECFDEANATCPIKDVCRLKGILHEAQANFIKTLGQYTLEDITQNQSSLRSALLIESE